MIIKYYLVDSENVNDNWLMLLDLAEPEDEIVVFYTKNSPHMSYASVVSLLRSDRSVRFEECHEGNNALDFQLVSYMGYLMKDQDAEYHIMSNDTGFDAAVRFWRERGFQTKRINVNYCRLQLQNLRKKAAAQAALEKASQSAEDVNAQAALEERDASVPLEIVPVIQDETVSAALEEASQTNEEVTTQTAPEETVQAALEEIPQAAEEEAAQTALEELNWTVPIDIIQIPQKEPADVIAKPETLPGERSAAPFDFNKEEVDFFINCMDKNNLAKIHETLVHVYGQKQGSNIYNIVKDKSYPFEKREYSRKEKIEHFLDIIFTNNQMKAPGDFVEFLEETKGKTKNLNSMRATIIKYYGNTNGMKYYSLFKPYFKTISAFQ